MEPIIIAVDGHSSCGKSTMARELADKLGYVYIDSGAMYRAATLFFLEKGLLGSDTTSLPKPHTLTQHLDEMQIRFRKMESGHADTFLNGENIEKEIRGMEVSRWVSFVSSVKAVRDKLVLLQQKMGEERGLVMDGRDIGTHVFPDAELKIFMTARPEVRAQRRFEELLAKGISVSLEEVLENLISRDREDSNRKESPLRKADTALTLDNSDISREEQLALALSWAKKVIAQKEARLSPNA